MMNVEIKYYLIMAGSTSHMLRGDKLLKDKGISTSLVPAPSEYGTVCATAIKVNREDKEKSEKLLRDNNIIIEGIYPDKPRKLLGLVEKLMDSVVSPEFMTVLKKIEEGEELALEDIVMLLKTERKAEKEALFHTADRMRKEVVGDVVDIRGAIEFSNYCRKDCLYCGIRKSLDNLSRYRMSENEIMEIVYYLYDIGLKTVILQSGEDLWWTPEKISSIIQRIKKETKMNITLSIGERPREEYELYRELGANNFLLKIETTNRKLFEFIHPDDDFDHRVKCSTWLRELGYLNGSGNIIGLPGQTIEDIARDIMFFKDMGINMIGIGPFVPAKGTPLESYPQGSIDMTLKAVAVTRIVCKRVFIPATTALASLDPDGQTKALKAGANTIMLINTPPKYRYSYQIYSDKNMVDLKSAFKAVEEAKRKMPPYLKVGREEM
ncbi:[FeFe] hydrogenase H-cluster radical SAM maturase HydE [Paramaledivibacter caminithermalis]|jgi:biotin synthase|uniref:Iron-only hydrogenase maturation protein HydE n=1 Tax=Paramaledivibacter caminithermalis (strain DSM 15212 / CIP 107654 / DViRD3) TaxID=1121301 RepID=A0A1M6KVW1_PARC5|nr:[FeFe] hydrogenase H-cluster radical SAM maturase HydE [Paramaledivibacter caminithermalis]SHJ63079.1 iron-only hydrogenase maturation protein HydE [Paramaledivibacter caminithermalis DSM 15212]